MKRKIYPILSTIMILALAAILGITIYENYNLKSDAKSAAALHLSDQERASGLDTALAQAQEEAAQKEEYIAGQEAYIEELSAQIQDLTKPEDTEEEPEDEPEDSPYEEDYPELYAQAEYDRRNGTDSDTDRGYGDKTVYLTFDDGPSELTPQVLDLLDEYDAKATFFVVRKSNEEYQEYLSEIVERGHTLAIHSDSHDYKKIYASVDAFLADYEKVYDWVYEETGHRPSLFRFPGGSTNGSRSVTSGIKREMERRGFVYYDWNVSSGDGSNLTTSANIIDNICSNVKNFDSPVVLMHDASGKNATFRALPTVLERLKGMGYSFKALDEAMEPVQF